MVSGAQYREKDVSGFAPAPMIGCERGPVRAGPDILGIGADHDERLWTRFVACSPRGHSRASRMANFWNGSPSGATARRSRRSLRGTGRWSYPSAGRHSGLAVTPMPRTHSRRRSLCWSAGRGRSLCTAHCRAGCTGWRGGSRARPGSRRRGGVRERVATGRGEVEPRTTLPATSSAAWSIRNWPDCPSGTGCRSCCATYTA